MGASEVFLSYNRDDQAVAQRFAASLQAQGYGVWWDTTLRTGDAYDEVTERALREARAVVVLWSRKSVVSRWVRSEATLADRNGTLVPVMIEPCERPIMFELTQTADLSHWSGDPTDVAWRAFLADLQHAIRTRRPAAPPAGSLPPGAVPPPAAATPIAQPGVRDHRPSLAILPFTNRSGERSDDVFAEGMVEDLVCALSLNRGLKVIAQSATAGYRGNAADLRRIGQDLDVRYLLEGNVRRAGGSLRVSAQLVEADTGTVLWVQKFDRPLRELADLQEQLATEVAAHLGIEMESAEMARALRKPGDLTAWEAVMRALAGYARITHKGLLASIAEARRAVDIQPDYALAHAVLADLLAVLSFTFMAGRDPSLVREARLHAERALALDTDDPLVLSGAGRALAICDDWKRGLEYCRRSVELNPNSALGRVNIAMLCLRHRLPEETMQHAEAALQLAPRGFMAYLLVANVALANFQLGRYEEALLSSERSLLLNPAFTYALKDKAVVLEKMGRRAEALDTLRKLRAAESSVTLEDLQAGNLGIFYVPEDAAEMNAALARLWPGSDPDAPAPRPEVPA